MRLARIFPCLAIAFALFGPWVLADEAAERSAIRRAVLGRLRRHGEEQYFRGRFADLRGPGTLDQLFALLARESDPALRAQFVLAIGDQGDPAAIERLRRHLEGDLAIPVAIALAWLGEPSPAAALARRIEGVAPDGDATEEGIAIQGLRAELRYLSGDAEAAIAGARKIPGPEGRTVEACLLARTGRIDDALDRLRQALAEGYSDLDWLLLDGDLAPVRADRRFRKLFPARWHRELDETAPFAMPLVVANQPAAWPVRAGERSNQRVFDPPAFSCGDGTVSSTVLLQVDPVVPREPLGALRSWMLSRSTRDAIDADFDLDSEEDGRTYRSPSMAYLDGGRRMYEASLLGYDEGATYVEYGFAIVGPDSWVRLAVCLYLSVLDDREERRAKIAAFESRVVSPARALAATIRPRRMKLPRRPEVEALLAGRGEFRSTRESYVDSGSIVSMFSASFASDGTCRIDAESLVATRSDRPLDASGQIWRDEEASRLRYRVHGEGTHDLQLLISGPDDSVIYLDLDLERTVRSADGGSVQVLSIDGFPEGTYYNGSRIE